MSEKPQQEQPGVPRETDDVAMLYEIMDRAMPNIPDPPGEEADSPKNFTGPENVSRETHRDSSAGTPTEQPSPPPPEKSRRSSVYVYLAVMFAAAFLMLLLAYFVQQRNNETALDDLRSINTASRQELLENIQRLEQENESLQQENELLNMRLDQLKEEREYLKEQVDENYYSTSEIRFRIVWNNVLNYLERFIEARDWLMAGVIIETVDYWYNEHNVEYSDFNKFKPTPSQTARYFELREEVLDKGRCMAVDRTYTTEDQSEYTERPYIAEDMFAEEDYQTAKSLLSVILYYPNDLNITAEFLFEYFPQADSSLERINSGAFKPSTVELYQQVRADVLAAAAMIELGKLPDNQADSGV